MISSSASVPSVTAAQDETDHVAARPGGVARPVARDATFLEPRPGGPAEQIANRYRHAPVAAPVIGTYLAGWLVLSSIFTVIGLVLTDVILAGARGNWDESINRWLVEQRTGWVDGVTGGATFMANTMSVVVLLGVSCLAFVFARHWREAVFLAGALTFEVTVFLTVNTLADRSRPDVPRMDSTPSTGSFPSGHVAASLALWVGLALIGSALVRAPYARLVMWAVAVTIAVVVGFARVYRGMHHLTDVLAGAALGMAALITSAVAVRVISALLAARHDHAVQPSTPEAVS